MSTVLTTKTQCLRSGRSATSSTWSTMMATAHATTPPRASSAGSATGRIPRMGRSSFQRSSSSSLPSPWASSSDRAENTTTSVSLRLDCITLSAHADGWQIEGEKQTRTEQLQRSLASDSHSLMIRPETATLIAFDSRQFHTHLYK